MSKRREQAGGTGLLSALADERQFTKGSTGTRAASLTTTGSLASTLIGLRPAQATYGFDSRGNRTSIVTPLTTTLNYDQANRLTKFAATGLTVTYGYNADGLRTDKTVNGTKTTYTWDTASNVPTMLTDGATSYVYGPGGQPLEQISGTTVRYYHQDQLGSTRAITDGTGAVVATYSYWDTGNPNLTTGTVTNPFRFAGEYADTDTGLIYLRNRYYDPTTAQFLTRDPLTSVTGSPYGYAGGNPINATDPLGLKFNFVATLNPWSKDNYFRQQAEQGTGVSKVIQTLNPAYHAISGYYNEWQAASNGCSIGTVAKFGLEGVLGTVLTVGAGLGGGYLAGGLGGAAADGSAGSAALSSPNFVAHANGDIVPVPDGAVGPTPVNSGNGFQFEGGSGGHGLDPRTTGVRIMDPVTSGTYQYPNGYVSYSNASGQAVDPYTGQTVGRANPWWHWPF